MRQEEGEQEQVGRDWERDKSLEFLARRARQVERDNEQGRGGSSLFDDETIWARHKFPDILHKVVSELERSG